MTLFRDFFFLHNLIFVSWLFKSFGLLHSALWPAAPEFSKGMCTADREELVEWRKKSVIRPHGLIFRESVGIGTACSTAGWPESGWMWVLSVNVHPAVPWESVLHFIIVFLVLNIVQEERDISASQVHGCTKRSSEREFLWPCSQTSHDEKVQKLSLQVYRGNRRLIPGKAKKGNWGFSLLESKIESQLWYSWNWVWIWTWEQVIVCLLT